MVDVDSALSQLRFDLRKLRRKHHDRGISIRVVDQLEDALDALDRGSVGPGLGIPGLIVAWLVAGRTLPTDALARLDPGARRRRRAWREAGRQIETLAMADPETARLAWYITDVFADAIGRDKDA